MFKELFDSGYKEYKRVEKIARQCENLAPLYEQMSDQQLKDNTVLFRERLKKGESIDDLTVEAFATVREAAKRVLGLYPFKVQIIGALALHGGNVAEMKTGEGKTLTATLTAYLNALPGDGVHIVTVNEYLASRDKEEMGELFKWLGLTVGLNLHDMDIDVKKKQYECDIMYTTCSEVGFDYLRDNMAIDERGIVQRPLNFAIIDEADSILIDEARTPLIISGSSGQASERYIKADTIVKQLDKDDYIFNVKEKHVRLTDKGIKKIEEYLKINNLYSIENLSYLHYIENSLIANIIYKLDVDYVVESDNIVLVDQFTGRLMYGRQLSNGLHQAIEAKERVKVNEKSITIATITIQNYFRMYRKLSGMTGTAKSEEDEFIDIYNMYVVEVPTNEPMIRIDKPYLFFLTEEEKYNAIAREVKRRFEKGQPVLIGTTSIEKSHYLSEVFKREKIPHTVLNAYHYAEEAKIVADAGQRSAVTIATNMAGRGTDIKLGKGIADEGGLLVIGTEIHEALRIDNQLRGRSGRQGDPGESQFYVSLEDELFIRHVEDSIKNIVNPDYFDNHEGVESKYYTKVFATAQRRIEAINYSIRKRVLAYDEVMSKMRLVVYGNRMKLLRSLQPLDVVEKIINSFFNRILKSKKNKEEDIITNLKNAGINLETTSGDITSEVESLLNTVKQRLRTVDDERTKAIQKMALHIISMYWMEHIDNMETLRQAVTFKRYGQIDDLAEYKRIGNEIFEQALYKIEAGIVRSTLPLIMQEEQREEKND